MGQSNRPNFEPLPGLQTAFDSWKEGDRELALEKFEAVSRNYPDSAKASIELASALGRLYRIADAKQALMRARELAKNEPKTISEIARVYADIKRVPEAIDYLESLPADVKNPYILGQLAVYQEQAGQFEEAAGTIEECLESDPFAPEPILIEARILTHLGRFEESAEQLVDLLKHLDDDSTHARLLIRTMYQLGDIFDRMGEYEKAMDAVVKAKSLQRKLPNAEQLAKENTEGGFRLGEVYRGLDKDVIDRWLEEDLPPLPGNILPAHLVGFPRSGTTLLEQVLGSHLQVAASSESLVFSDEVLPRLLNQPGATGALQSACNVSKDTLIEFRSRYMRCLKEVADWQDHPQLHLDKKPAHTAYLFALLRVLPESKFVVALRDPRDVITSCFMRYFPLSNMSACFLSWGGTVLNYAQMMEIWLYMREQMNRSSWCEVRYENVCNDLEDEANRVFRFLGLQESEDVADYLQKTRNRVVHSPTFAEVRKPIHKNRTGRWENYAEYLEPFMESINPFLDAFDYSGSPHGT